jgi:hypothetical protein
VNTSEVSAWDKAGVFVNVGTMIIVAVYTWLTRQLANEAATQRGYTAKLVEHSQQQAEDRITPVVVVTRVEHHDVGLRTLLLRNIGAGAALNVELRLHIPQWKVYVAHADTIAAGDESPWSLKAPDVNLNIYSEAALYDALTEDDAPDLLTVEISYDSLARQRFMTQMTLSRDDVGLTYAFNSHCRVTE